ncbi:MAG: response regulator transcription factor [Sphingobacteriia bacterium]|nr:response regulator transcription factor [Sphingobacteriia bacterium]
MDKGIQKVKVLLAEDDKNLGSVLKSYLDVKGYDATLCVNGQEAINTFEKGYFSFCIVDVMMPIKDGFTLVKEIRERDKTIPVLFLTAKSMQEDKLKGFSLGADDYLTKPFSMEELLVRMQAILRRARERRGGEIGNNIFKIGEYIFDFNRQLLSFKDKDQKLTSKESALLRLLSLNLNQVLDRSYALKEIWNDDSYFNARSMDVYITKLRKFLKDDKNVELINVHGIGFKLVSSIAY